MDIRQLAVEETAILHLRNASDELAYADEEKKKPIQIVLYGPGSKTFRAAQAKQSARIMERLRRKNKKDLSPDEEAEERAAFLSACTKSFENIVFDELKGDALFKAVYTEPSLGFIADQVNAYLGDWGNFTKSSK